MSIHEIVLPETKPETEWILGRALQKASGLRTHAMLQTKFGIALMQWEKDHGCAAIEWRFRIAPPDEIRRPLVPDVSYVSFERLAGLEGLDVESPPFAPNVAVEVLQDDPSWYLEHKIGVYFAGGASLVIVVDPSDRSVRLHDAQSVRVLGGDDVIAHPALPGFALPLPELFAAADPPRL